MRELAAAFCSTLTEKVVLRRPLLLLASAFLNSGRSAAQKGRAAASSAVGPRRMRMRGAYDPLHKAVCLPAGATDEARHTSSWWHSSRNAPGAVSMPLGGRLMRGWVRISADEQAGADKHSACVAQHSRQQVY